MAEVNLYFFGAVRGVRGSGEPVTFQGRKVVGLLAYLALTGTAHRREHLASLFWPDLPEKASRNNLRVTLARMSRGLGVAPTPFLLADRQTVQFNPEAEVWIDVHAFERSLAEAKDAEGRNDYHDALERAVERYGGAFLEGFYLEGCDAFEEWQLSVREQHHIRSVEALAEVSVFYEAEGDFASAERYTRRQLVLEPLLETAHRRLMRLLSYQANRNAALEHYQAYQHDLQSELGIEPEDETVTLYHQIQAGSLATPGAAAVSPPSEDVAKHNLPNDLTPFVGREEELEQLKTHLEAQRLITLLGIGGSGKTRLALELARSQLEAFGDGTFFVRLAPLQSATDIPMALAEAVSFRFQQGHDLEAQVLSHVADKRMLLMLDNFEHVLEGRSFVTKLLKAAPELKLLVTSREKLSLTAEAVYAVAGLSYQTALHAAPEAANSAAQLFLDTARRVRLDFEPHEDDLAHVVRICRLVEGHPLAIILAAGWLESLSLAEISEELSTGIELLATHVQDMPDRQRSIRAAFNHSWRLLSPEEQGRYASMAVFRGGFDRRAAKEVVETSLPQLTRFLNKSLIQHRLEQGRYELHELMRQFAEEKLTELGRTAEVRDLHSACYLSALVAWERDFQAGRRDAALASFDADFDNVRVAWQWATQRERAELLAASVSALRLFATLRSRYQTLIQLLEPVAPLSKAMPEFELKVHVALGMAYRSIRGYLAPEVKQSFERAFELSASLAESPELFSVLYGLWSYYFVGVDFEKALGVVTQWRERLASTGNDRDAYLDDAELVVHHIEGAIRYQMGEFSRARDILERGVSLYKPERHEAFIASYGQDPAVFCRNWLALSYWMLGYPDKAWRTAIEAIRHASAHDHPFTQVFALFCAVQVSLLRLDDANTASYAETLLRQSIENNFVFFEPLGSIAKGRVVSKEDRQEGLALMEEGLERYPGTVQKETFGSYVVQALIEAGRLDRALQLADEILASTQGARNAVFDAGLLHLKAEAYLEQDLVAEAESHFERAIELAKRQGAKMLELRATTSYCRFLADREGVARANDVLSEVYAFFTEGFDTADLNEARMVLDEFQEVAQAKPT